LLRAENMEEFFARVWENLVARVTGPMSFRLLLQPTVAIIMAVRAGLEDARTGRPPYNWAILTADPAQRRELLRSGWKSIGKVFCLAVVLDIVYQIIALRWVYPGETLLVAFLLACVPYLLIRGPLDRLLRALRSPERREHQ
jgi:hypothetical protein